MSVARITRRRPRDGALAALPHRSTLVVLCALAGGAAAREVEEGADPVPSADGGQAPPLATERVAIALHDKVVATTSRAFIGIALDYWGSPKWDNATSTWGPWAAPYDLSPPELLTLAKALSPATLRVGGATQDSIVYQPVGGTCPPPRARSPGYHCSQDHDDVVGCISHARWDALDAFSRAAGLDLVFGLSACGGRAAKGSPFDLASVSPLLEYAASRAQANSSALFGFELGNELDLGVYNGCDGVEPEALAADLVRVAARIEQLWPDGARRPRVLGPDIAAFTGSTAMPTYFGRFLANAELVKVLHATTFHQYPYCNLPGNGTILDLACLDKMRSAAQTIGALSQRHGVATWVGESSNCWTGGVHNVSDVVVDFLYFAQQLSVMATNNVSVVVRQAFLGGIYEMINHESLQPQPSYWAAWLWRRLVGTRVLAFATDPPLGPTSHLHVSAHCSATTHGATVVLINWDTSSARSVAVSQVAPGVGTADVDVFAATGEAYGAALAVNGHPLQFRDGELPTVQPVRVAGGATVSVPAGSVAFVQTTAAVPACGGGVAGGAD